MEGIRLQADECVINHMATEKRDGLEPNVLSFIDRCAMAIGRDAEDIARQDFHSECLECGMESPIEHVLYCAIRALAKVNGIQEDDGPFKVNGELHMFGLHVQPQVVVGKYRVDFIISREQLFCGPTRCEKQEIIVECDSQEFHERTEPERRYEKRRDRFLVSQGYKVFHFTGTEIVKEPFRVAAEILREFCSPECTIDELLSPLESLDLYRMGV